MPNDDWLLFDNGTHHNFDPNPGTYSRAVAFRIDPVKKTVQQVWTYGKERGAATYSAIVSRVEFLPEVNHMRFCPGYQVATATGLGGKIIEVDYATRQPVFEMSLTTRRAMALASTGPTPRTSGSSAPGTWHRFWNRGFRPGVPTGVAFRAMKKALLRGLGGWVLAKFGYDHVTNPQDFGRVYDTLNFEASKQELDEAINTKPEN